MTTTDAFNDILKLFATCVGVPACNVGAHRRRQGDGKLQIVTPENKIIGIGANDPDSGYIRWNSTPTSTFFRGCSTYRYTANFSLILWKQGGTLYELQSRAEYWLKKCNFRPLRYSLIDTNINEIFVVYEDIYADEHDMQPPTQAGLAVVKIDFVVSFVSSDCQLTLPVCPSPVIPEPPIPPLPPSVQLFFNNAQIQDPALRSIVLDFYNTIIGRSYFAKLDAMYLFVGGNANAHKFNFLDAQDLDTSYRLQFNGGWTHTPNGVLGNAINTFAQTYWNEVSAGATENSWNFGIYSRTQSGNQNWCDIGMTDGVRNSNVYARILVTNPDRLYLRHGGAGTFFTAGATQTVRLYQVNRVDTTNIRARINGALVIQPTPYIGKSLVNYFIGGLSNNSGLLSPTGRELGYAFIASTGFTDAELIDHENDVTILMTALGRNV